MTKSQTATKKANVDKRIKIVWEDCGAFPYNYSPALINDYEQTVDFTEKTTRLRGEQAKIKNRLFRRLKSSNLRTTEKLG